MYSSLHILFHSMPVAKKKSLFDDRPMEIQELTYIIKQVHCIVDLPSVEIREITLLYILFCNSLLVSIAGTFLENLAH